MRNKLKSQMDLLTINLNANSTGTVVSPTRISAVIKLEVKSAFCQLIDGKTKLGTTNCNVNNRLNSII